MDVEQIINESTVHVKVDIVAKLGQLPVDDRQDAISMIGRLVKAIFYEEKVAGVWLTTAVAGYCGKDEYLDKLREIWVRRFPEPLPPCHSLRLRDYGELFTFSLGRKQYVLSKLDGRYLEHTTTASTS
ncbi:hypothetical protein HYU17_01920 [Candidatus Woesearchaeota archaeon]|nr:hypothetical protein [Candidatus Woesearchaeota archaeon]